MKKLDRHDISAARDYDLQKVEVPEWEGIVYLKPHHIIDLIEMEGETVALNDQKYVAVYLAHSITDEDGKRLYPDAQGIEDLSGKSLRVLMRLFDLAVAINKASKEDEGDREKK